MRHEPRSNFRLKAEATNGNMLHESRSNFRLEAEAPHAGSPPSPAFRLQAEDPYGGSPLSRGFRLQAEDAHAGNSSTWHNEHAQGSPRERMRQVSIGEQKHAMQGLARLVGTAE
jgi:hypothetical protein